MELYNKIFVKDKESAQSIIDDWKSEKVDSFLNIDDFKEFPCVFSYYIDRNDYGMSYASRGYYSIVYFSDFEL